MEKHHHHHQLNSIINPCQHGLDCLCNCRLRLGMILCSLTSESLYREVLFDCLFSGFIWSATTIFPNPLQPVGIISSFYLIQKDKLTDSTYDITLHFLNLVTAVSLHFNRTFWKTLYLFLYFTTEKFILYKNLTIIIIIMISA